MRNWGEVDPRSVPEYAANALGVSPGRPHLMTVGGGFLPRRSIILRSLSALALPLLVACGSATPEPTSPNSTTPAALTPDANGDPQISSPDSPAAPDGGPVRSPSPQPPSEPAGDIAIDRDLLPEYTAARPSFDQVTMNGVTYPSAMVVYSNQDPQRVEIDAGRKRDRFQGSLSIPDDQTSESAHQVDISLDNGPPVFSALVRFGETKQIDLDVSGALRIKITYVSVGARDGRFGIGSPRFR